MHEGCEANPTLYFRKLVIARESLKIRMIVAQFEGTIQKLFQIHRLLNDLSRGQSFALVNKVFAAELLRRHVERTGYPVLMRNLDLPTPVDLYPVREIAPDPSAAQSGTVIAPLLESVV